MSDTNMTPEQIEAFLKEITAAADGETMTVVVQRPEVA
jgi:hypothetical protein